MIEPLFADDAFLDNIAHLEALDTRLCRMAVISRGGVGLGDAVVVPAVRFRQFAAGLIRARA